MPKDKRYKTIRILIEGNHISTFKEVFDHIPKTIVGKDLGIHFRRFNRMVIRVQEIKVKDIFQLSVFFGVDEMLVFNLIYTQLKKAKKKEILLDSAKELDAPPLSAHP